MRQNTDFCYKDTELNFSMLFTLSWARKDCFLLGKIEAVTVNNYSVQAQVSD